MKDKKTLGFFIAGALLLMIAVYNYFQLTASQPVRNEDASSE